MISIFSMHNW